MPTNGSRRPTPCRTTPLRGKRAGVPPKHMTQPRRQAGATHHPHGRHGKRPSGPGWVLGGTRGGWIQDGSRAGSTTLCQLPCSSNCGGRPKTCVPCVRNDSEVRIFHAERKKFNCCCCAAAVVAVAAALVAVAVAAPKRTMNYFWRTKVTTNDMEAAVNASTSAACSYVWRRDHCKQNGNEKTKQQPSRISWLSGHGGSGRSQCSMASARAHTPP